MNYSKHKLDERYETAIGDFSIIGVQLANTRTFLDSLGIQNDTKFVIFTDRSPNGGLYFIRKKGWSIADTSEIGASEINTYKNEGARYLLNTHPNSNIPEQYGVLIGTHDNIGLFDLTIK
jgi:hypothetical protein